MTLLILLAVLFVFQLLYKIAVSYTIKCVSEASYRIIYSLIWDRWGEQCNSRYGKKQQEGIFSWTKRLIRQVVQRILDTVLWPSPVRAHWVTCQQNLCQTWEWTFSTPWDKMVMKCPSQNHGQVYEWKGALPTEDWHLPSTSTKIKSWPLQLLTFNTPERSSGWKSGVSHSVLWEKLAEQAFR